MCGEADPVLHPCPDCSNYRAQVRMVWLPPEGGERLSGVSDQSRGITGPTRHESILNRLPGDLSRGLDHFQDTESDSVCEVVRLCSDDLGRQKPFGSEQVRQAQVRDMDVVTDT